MSPPPTDELSKQGIGIKGGSPDIFEEEPVSGSRRCVDVSLFVHPLAPLQQQGQALVAHYVDKLKALPKEAVRLLANAFGVSKTGKKRGVIWDTVAHCLGIAPDTTKRIWTGAQHWGAGSSQWQPVVPGVIARSKIEKVSAAEEQDTRERMVRNAVREALATAVEGQSYSAYERQMVRNSLSEAMVGSRLGSRRVAQQFVNLGAMVMQLLDAEDFHTKLPGIGVPSHYGVSMDGVPIGVGHMTSHDELLVVCLYIVSAQTFVAHSPMLAAPAMPFDGKTGEGMRQLASRTLAEHPANLNTITNIRRGSGIGGDGGVTKGGPAARHKTNSGAELLWREWHPAESTPICTNWDVFHQSDLGFWRAAKELPPILEVFDVGKQVQNMFGFGRGAVLARAIGALGPAEDIPKSMPGAGGTRKTGHMAVVTGSVIHNLPTIVKGLHARIVWSQRKQSGGSYSLKEMEHLSGRLTDVGFVTNLLLLDSIVQNIIQPFSRKPF